MEFEEIISIIDNSGMEVFGAFYPSRSELVEGIDKKTKTIVLIGNAGPKMWVNFIKSHPKTMIETRKKKLDLLDQWTYEVVSKMAEKMDCQTVYPFSGPPYFPFQKWAVRTNDIWQSPIAFLIHREFGLWHAYRAALCFSKKIQLIDSNKKESPCIGCEEKPCLTRCPVNAFSDKGFNAVGCSDHISSEKGSQCFNGGCLARLACPIGTEYVYPKLQAKFHMKEFVKNFRFS